MSSVSPDQALGAYLKALRVAAGMDVAVLARRLSLSPAQLSQLENGQGSLFYNERIRHQAARKVIAHLGGDPSRVDEATVVAATVAEPALERATEAMAALPEPAPAPVPAQPLPSRPKPSMRWAFALMLLGVGAGAVYVVGSRHLGRPTSFELAKASEQENASTPPARSPAASVDTTPMKVAVADSPPMQVAALDVPPGVQDGPSRSLPAPAEACPGLPDRAPSVRAPDARKAGDMVYVVSTGTVSVCLSDGSGKQHRKRLEAGQSHSFYGQPPWLVHSDQLRQTQLYFQGWKVRLPEQTRDIVRLVEVR